MAKAARRWTVEPRAANIHRIEIRLPHVGDEQRILLQSDVHEDNPHTDRDLLETHLDQADGFDAPVLDNGDWFCAMQGRWDPRANKDDLRPEHRTARYLDSLIETAAARYKRYQHLFTVRGKGNHETAILKRHETDLTERFVERLKAQGAKDVYTGGYAGWVVVNVIHGKNNEKPFKLHYHHGWGGGGPVTRGVIQTNRMAAYLADADIVFTGHTHDSWQMVIPRIRLNQDCTQVQHTRQTYVRVGGYKAEYRNGEGGWAVEKGMPPKPLGSAWVIFKHVPGHNGGRSYVDYDIVEAK